MCLVAVAALGASATLVRGSLCEALRGWPASAAWWTTDAIRLCLRGGSELPGPHPGRERWMSETTLHPSDGTALTPVENAGAPAARWGGSSRRSGVSGWLALVMAAVALSYGAVMTRSAAAAEPWVGLGSGGPFLAQAPECVPVPGAECGSVRVPLFRSRPEGRDDRHRLRAAPPHRPDPSGRARHHRLQPGRSCQRRHRRGGGLGGTVRRPPDRPRPAADRPPRHGPVASARLRDRASLAGDQTAVPSHDRALRQAARPTGARVHHGGDGR